MLKRLYDCRNGHVDEIMEVTQKSIELDHIPYLIMAQNKEKVLFVALMKRVL